MRVIGIDPALQNVGLCVLESSGPREYRVIESATIRTFSNTPLPTRLKTILTATRDFLRQDAEMIVVEDPTKQIRIQRSRPGNIAAMGTAVGVVLSAVIDRGEPIIFLDTDEWMPKIKSGNFEHMMPHAQMTRYLMGLIKFPPKVSEHVVMAAGVARFWIERERFNQRRMAG